MMQQSLFSHVVAVAVSVAFFIDTSSSAPTESTIDDPDCPVIYQDYDYIVVGGGSSGSVIAARLTEDPDVRVLLLEAGGKPPRVADIPLKVNDVLASEVNWNYTSEPQTNCCIAFPNGVTPLFSGRALGGTSNINSMIFTRGNKEDYDRIGQLGIKGWNYDDVLPFFIKMEDYVTLHRREDDQFHGHKGPQVVGSPIYKTPLAEAFLQAGEELGQFQVDVNAKYHTGFMPTPTNVKNGTRWGSYHAYLEPAMTRENLLVVTRATVEKVDFDERKRATGVVFYRGNSRCTAGVSKEVILSAGALRTPQILLLSGIGNQTELREWGIPVVTDLPGVGQNLQDHVYTSSIQFYLGQNISFNKNRLINADTLELWEKSRTGPLTSNNAVEGIAFFRSTSSEFDQEPDYPEFEISMYSDAGIAPQMFEKKYQNSFAIEKGKDAVTFIPILLRPKSSGQVTLRSTNPFDQPRIDPRYLSHPADAEKLREVLKIALSIGRSAAFKKYGSSLIKFNSIPGCDQFESDSDEFWLCFVRRFSTPGWHFVGSAKMGTPEDEMRVVDYQLRVYGVKGLRVADASVMPHVPAGHTYAITIMIGERIAHFIKSPID